MKIILNTFYKNAPASMFYYEGFSKSSNFKFNIFDHYNDFDVALFMTYEKDLEELKKARLKNSKLIIGLIDPRGSQVEQYLCFVDFLIIDSLEMKDCFSKYNLPLFTYYEYPDILILDKKHTKKNKIILGYHGNKLHLVAMFPKVTSALELLSQKYNLEFWAMYNINHLGKWDVGLPKKVKVKHIQWNKKNYEKYISKVDIGIVPACMPIKIGTKKKSSVSKFFNDNNDDYLLKFKMPSNPGRVITFAQLGVPVVADFIPSYLQFIKDEENGMLAYSTGGWFRAIEKLINSHSLRQKLSTNMKKTFHRYFEYKLQNKKFLHFLNNLVLAEKKTPIVPIKHSYFEKLKFNNVYIHNFFMWRIRK